MADDSKQTLRDLEISLSALKKASNQINNLDADIASSLSATSDLTKEFKKGADIAVKLAEELNKASLTEFNLGNKINQELKNGNLLEARKLKIQPLIHFE